MSALKDRLRKTRTQNTKKKRLTLDVPGWSGVLQIRYKPIEWEQITDLLAKSEEGDASAALEANVETLIEAAEAFLVRRDDDDGEPVLDAKGDQIFDSLAQLLRDQGETVNVPEVRFDAYLADALSLTVETNAVGEVVPTGEGVSQREPETASETVLSTFAGCVSPALAIAGHASALGVWISGLMDEANKDSLGESGASPR